MASTAPVLTSYEALEILWGSDSQNHFQKRAGHLVLKTGLIYIQPSQVLKGFPSSLRFRNVGMYIQQRGSTRLDDNGGQRTCRAA